MFKKVLMVPVKLALVCFGAYVSGAAYELGRRKGQEMELMTPREFMGAAGTNLRVKFMKAAVATVVDQKIKATKREQESKNESSKQRTSAFN